jgi:hypothetical protein
VIGKQNVTDHPFDRIAPALNDGVLQRTGELTLGLHTRQLGPLACFLLLRNSGRNDGTSYSCAEGE